MQSAGLIQFSFSSTERPGYPPRTGVQPSESPGNIKPDRTFWIPKLLSEARWGQPQASSNDMEKALKWAHCLFSHIKSPQNPGRQVFLKVASGGAGWWPLWCEHLTTMTHFRSSSETSSFSWSSPLLPPSIPYARSVPTFYHHLAIARTAKYLSLESAKYNVMPTLLTVLSQLSPCIFLGVTILSHTPFLHQTKHHSYWYSPLLLKQPSKPLSKASLYQSPSWPLFTQP